MEQWTINSEMDANLDYCTQSNYLPLLKEKEKMFYDIERLKNLIFPKPTLQKKMPEVMLRMEKRSEHSQRLQRETK